MPTITAVSTQEFSKSQAGNTPAHSIRRAVRSLKTKLGTRYAKVAGMAFALTLPALGIVDPEVLLASGLSDARSMEMMVSRADAALRNMAVVELFATGGVAVLALAAVAGAGYLRTRYKAARQEELTAE